MQRDRHFEEFRDHTLLKHFLLVAYLKAWATILLKSRARRIWFVDAFAGAGGDSKGRPGSPVLAAQVAQVVNSALVAGGATKTTGMHVIAIEKDGDNFRSLSEQLAPWTALRPQYVHVRPGTLATMLDGLLEHAAGDAILFFLDPCGIDGLSAALLPRVLAGERNEVLALFADTGALRLHGAAAATAEPIADPVGEVLQNLSIFGEVDDAERLENAHTLRARRVAGRESGLRDKAILDTAMGGDEWVEIIRATPRASRRQRFVELYRELLGRCGAQFTLAFRVETSTGQHKYHLVHASKHERAFVAMKEAMHHARNERVATQDAVQLSALLADNNVARITDQLATELAGRTLRWSNGREESVKNVAIGHTALWLHECDALKAALVARGWGVKEGRSQAFAFPPT